MNGKFFGHLIKAIGYGLTNKEDAAPTTRHRANFGEASTPRKRPCCTAKRSKAGSSVPHVRSGDQGDGGGR